LPFAEKISAEWKGTSATGGTTKNFIGGEFVESKASQWFDVLDPVKKMILFYDVWLTRLVYANIG
jgi:malonate-semialdehyde dehydrogenase (acetylating)/methylmalonate-semialdehyde dehydrogenase